MRVRSVAKGEYSCVARWVTSRKQKCGGVTEAATCVSCQTREVACSFEMEARDPRFNPYLRIQKAASPRREESHMRTLIATSASTLSPTQPRVAVQHPERTGTFQYVTAILQPRDHS